MTQIARILVCVSLLAGCGNLASIPGLGPGLSKEQLLAGEPILKGQPLPELPEVDLLAVTPEMREFLNAYVDPEGTDRERLHQLQYAIITKGTFGISYNDRTRTAAHTFRTRSGNCLSFTSMFIALAREAQLKASFQEVEIPPSWEQQGSTMVFNRHINVSIGTSSRGLQGGERIVDFNIVDFKASYKRKKVSDTRAAAHFYSNLGVDKLQANQLLDSFLHFRRGLEVDPRFGPLWTNLGALYSMAGAPDYAEASYFQALKGSGSDTVALSNLARLYDRQGKASLAASYRNKVTRHRARNPYYRAAQAREAYDGGDYNNAKKHIRFALSKKPEEAAFHHLLGKVFISLGEPEKAKSALERAEELSPDKSFEGSFNKSIRENLD